ncbi:NPC intracellular cholesterol transporter 2 [Holothuria leucospilota]|uniref:NPC intracellular cholesterol transporter 2 n=1 Tax=Holothuria leucospilota TaxID=206669 RepID=A0A9Q1CH38_HOLLE|nr:NPC intracellular cholesterol transporter 2 [Holothuria leucospilota]
MWAIMIESIAKMIGRFETILFVSLVLSLTCVILVDSKTTKFKDCGSKESKVSSVDISPCSTSPCEIVSGKNSSIDVTFTETAAADNLTAKAYGSIAGVKVPYPLPNPEACKNSNLTCPLKTGTKYFYTATLSVPKGLPKVDVVVELQLIAGDDKLVMCIDFPVTVSPGNSKKEQMHP